MRDVLFRRTLVYGIVLLLLGIGMVLNAGGDGEEDIVLDYSFDEPIIENITNCDMKYHRVTLPGLSNSNNPGEPCLPIKTARVLIPQNYTIENINVTVEDEIFLNGSFFIEPGQQSYPLNYNWSAHNGSMATPPNATIYNSSQHYPNNTFQRLSLQEKRGYHILFLNLYPVRYIPQSKEIYYYTNMTVTVSLTSTEPNYKNYRGLTKDENIIKNMVDNPEDISSYPLGDQSGGTYDYIIITDANFSDAFQKLTDWKETRGKYTEYANISTTIMFVDNITDNSSFWYDGYWGDGGDGGDNDTFNDTQCKIRNFIKMAYNNWSVDYVLLGGDGDGGDVGGESGDDIIPVRYFYSRYDIDDPPIPADMYYSNLNGSFNSDNDNFSGEPGDGYDINDDGEVDLLSEVYVGRAPVDSLAEAWNFVNKTIAYENTSIDDPYLKKALFVGEYMGFGGPVDYGCESMEEIRHGSDNGGYVTEGFYKGYEVDFLYDKLSIWDKSELITKINSNLSIISHMGHGNNYHVMKLDHPLIMKGGVIYGECYDIDNLTNNQYFFVYSQACFPGAFDNWNGHNDTYLGYDSIAEHLVTGEHGAFAVVMNSRSGWGSPFATDSSTQRYNREFWDALFSENESFTRFSEANQDSKEDNIGLLTSPFFPQNQMRYCYYELNLLGDPETQLKNFSNPLADINAPVTGSQIEGKIIKINGTAAAENFSNYSVFYKQGMDLDADDDADDPSWIQLNSSDFEVFDGVLCSWNISSLTNGYYTLKLKVKNISQENEDRVVIKIWQIAIPGTWQTENIAQTCDIDDRINMALDGQDRPHVVYKQGDNGFNYSWRDVNGSWHPEQINDNCGFSLSIDLDQNDNPHIVYYNDSGLCYAYWDGSSWINDIVDLEGIETNYYDPGVCYVDYCCIKIENSTDTPHISYHANDGDNDILKYARLENGTWNVTIIDESLTDERDGGNNLALDSNNYPHICYEEEGLGYQNYVRYAYWDGSDWHKNVTIEEGKDLAETGLAIRINSSDVPHVIYDKSGFLMHAWKNSTGGWQKEEVMHGMGIAFPSMVIDDYDFIHVSFVGCGENFWDVYIAYMRYNGNGWFSERAYELTWSSWSVSLAVDSNQLPHIIHLRAFPDMSYKYTYLSDMPPNTPQLISPGNNTVVDSSDVLLEVFVSDPDDDNEVLNVKFINNKTGETIGCLNNRLGNMAQSIVWCNLNSSTNYEWYVIVNDTIFEKQSEVWNFTVETMLPEITNVSNNPNTVGFGFNVTVAADVTDNASGVDTVNVSVSYPDDSSKNFTMNNTAGDTYEYIFSVTWLVGQYNYTIWAKDKVGNSNSSSEYNFTVSAQLNVSVKTLEDDYYSDEYINLTDPPDPTPDIGYELLDDNSVLHMWNTKNDYYFNVSSGVQMTNHYDEYWSHNVLMLGYHDGDEWNLIYRTDELSGFNREIDTDNETYINITLWKDLTYQGYSFRLAVRYHLGVDDSDLTVIPYIKNLGEEIPYVLGFGWEINDIQIANTRENDWIRINDTQYQLHQDLDLRYRNLTHTYRVYNETTNTTTNYTVPNPSFVLEGRDEGRYFRRTLYLSWDENLDYLLWVKSRSGQYNAPVSLFIKIGDLPEDAERSTMLHWLDSDDWLGVNGGNLHSFSGEDTSGILSAALNGTSVWVHSTSPVHWFIIDLEDTYTIKKVRGRSYDFFIPPHAGDPNDVNIYVYDGETAPACDNTSAWGSKVNSENITTWVDTTEWQEVDIKGANGRYIKVEVLSTDADYDYIEWGYLASPNTIFDVYASDIESKIENTGDTDCKGRLLINVEYYDNGSWIVADDTINNETVDIIPAGGHMKLDTIFNDIVSTSDLCEISGDTGLHRVYVAFRDPDGNVLINDYGIPLNASYEFDVTIYPEINNVTVTTSNPLDTDSSYGWENFTCTVTDNVDVDDVKLVLIGDATNEYTMTKDGDEYYYNMTISTADEYTYHIWANDTSDNENTSTPQSFDMPMNEDVNMDGCVHFVDIMIVAGMWSETGPNGWHRADVDNSGVVGFVDIMRVSGHYNECWRDRGEPPAGDNDISVLPANQTVSVNETFTVSIYVEPGEAINGVSIDFLYFNASLVHANSVTKGALFDPYSTLFSAGTIDNVNGKITDVYGLTLPATNTVTENGYFCNISFTAQQEIGVSDLDLDGVIISNVEDGSTPTVYDGNVTVQQ